MVIAVIVGSIFNSAVMAIPRRTLTTWDVQLGIQVGKLTVVTLAG